MRLRAFLLTFLIAFLGATRSYAATHSVELDVARCQIVFSQVAAQPQLLEFRPARVDIEMTTTIRDEGMEPFVIPTRLTDPAQVGEILVGLIPQGEGVLVRWWTGLPDEFLEFPMAFEQGDWQTLVSGGVTSLLAPEDVVSNVTANTPGEVFDPSRYFGTHVVTADIPEPGTMRIDREEPFRPRFTLKNGFLVAEGMLSSSVISLELEP